jgi:hypothetical protein
VTQIIKEDSFERYLRESAEGKTGIFRDHSCWKCNDGAKPCVRKDGHSRLCEYPYARND